MPSMPWMGESMTSMAVPCQLEDAVADALDGGLAGFGVADDAALADVAAAGFELRLDEDDGVALPGLIGSAEGCEDSGQDEGGGDEGDVHGEEGWEGLWRREEFAGGEEAGVGALAEGDAGIVAELLGDLAVAGVDGQDGCGAALQHAVGEAAGGGSDVDAGEAGEVDGPVGEGVLEFEAAAADVFEIGAEEADGGVAEMEVPGLSMRCSSTRTRPARMRAWARSREAAWPWSTRSLSRRTFSGRSFAGFVILWFLSCLVRMRVTVSFDLSFHRYR